ncbi:MAG: hypothetical protein Q4D05_09315 [Acinetobacter sp.]|nr:hypothetical protein [Acinetobacter sp.]
MSEQASNNQPPLTFWDYVKSFIFIFLIGWGIYKCTSDDESKDPEPLAKSIYVYEDTSNPSARIVTESGKRFDFNIYKFVKRYNAIVNLYYEEIKISRGDEVELKGDKKGQGSMTCFAPSPQNTLLCSHGLEGNMDLITVQIFKEGLPDLDTEDYTPVGVLLGAVIVASNVKQDPEFLIRKVINIIEKARKTPDKRQMVRVGKVEYAAYYMKDTQMILLEIMPN